MNRGQQPAALLALASLLAGCAIVQPAAVPATEPRIGHNQDDAVTRNSAAPSPVVTRDKAPAVTATAAPSAATAAQRAEAIRQYRQLLQSDIDLSTRQEVVRRLAQLEMQQADAAAGQSQNADRSQNNAIALYEQLLQSNPDGAGNDRVLYQLAHAYDKAGRTADSLQALSRLLQQYPDSPLAAESRFRRAELHFAAGRYAQAQTDYQLLASGKSDFAALARRKLGWCALKLNQPQQALQLFLAVLDQQLPASFLNPDHSGYSDSVTPDVRELDDDALRGAAVALALISGPTAAAQHLNPPRIYEPMLYQRLAQTYVGNGDSEKAGRTYQAFIQAHPEAPASGTFALQAADLLASSGDTAGALAATESWLLQYGTPAAVKRPDAPATDLLQKRYWQVLSNLHARAQSSKATADYQQAEQWYQRALARFPDQDDWRYRYADLCFEAGDYSAAAGLYQQLAYASKDFGKAQTAAYAEVLARRKLSTAQDPASETALLQSIQRLLKAYPQHPERAALQAEAARLALKLQQDDTARQYAQASLQGGGNSSSQILALAVLAQTALDKKQWQEAEQAASQWLTLAPADDKNRDAMRELRARAVYQQGDAARSAGNNAAAIASFLRLRSLAPPKLNDAAGHIRAKAQFDAAALQINDKQWAAAAGTLEQLRSDFPDYPEQLEISRRLAQCYSQLGDKQHAAMELAKLASGSSDTEVARAAALQSADLLRDSGNATQAIAGYSSYVEHYPEPLAAAQQVRSQLAQLQRSRRHYWLQQILAHSSSNDDLASRTFAAKAALALAEDKRQEFLAVSLSGQLAKTLPHKRKLMRAAIDAFSRADRFGIAEVSTEAVYRSGEMLAHMADELDALPPPAGLKPEQVSAYQQLIAQQTTPLRAKARQIWQANISQAQTAGLQQNAWVLRSQSSLAALPASANPVQNPAPATTEVQPHAQ